MILVNFLERIAHSLIYHERPERIAHGCSFFMCDLSDSLTVAHLSWAIWANRSQSLIWFERSERMSDERSQRILLERGHKFIFKKIEKWIQEIFYFIYVFASGGGFPPLPWDFTVLNNDPAAPQDHCGRCRIRTRDFCPRSLAHYQWATTSPKKLF